MDDSPKGREITTLDGNAETIVSRGNKITTLGDQMISSAALLKDIADGASGQKGLAVEKLQEVVGDCHEELKLAGERYKPTGPVLVTYGNVLAEVQPLIKTAVENCESDWKTYQTKQSGVWDAQMAYYPTVPATEGEEPEDPADARKEAVDDAQGLADSAYGDWRAEAKIFDTHYDTWEAAFDKAAEDIGTANSGGIEDSTWDDIDGFVAGALEVLKWVGLALAILGVIIGGPFIAALAAIAAIATLLLTIYSFARGNSTALDLVFAVVGVIPFGSLGKLFSGNKLGFLDDMAGGLLSSGGRANIFGEVGGVLHGITTGYGRAGSFLPGLVRGARGGALAWMGPNGMGAGNIISRLFTGQNMNYFNQGGLSGGSILGSVWGDGMFKTVFGIPDGPLDLHNNWFPTPELSEPLFGTPKR
jgi:hypothetical protein